MNIQLLKNDVTKSISIWGFNDSVINELTTLHSLYENYFSKFGVYSLQEADVAAFVIWSEEVSNALATGFMRTSAASIYASLLVNRLSRKPAKAVDFADMLASKLGMTMSGIVKTVCSSNKQTGTTVKRPQQKDEKLIQVQDKSYTPTAKNYTVRDTSIYSGCTGGSISSTRC